MKISPKAPTSRNLEPKQSIQNFALAQAKVDTIHFSSLTAPLPKKKTVSELNLEANNGYWYKKTVKDKTLYFISPKGVEHFNLSNGDDESNVYIYLHQKQNTTGTLLEAHNYNLYSDMPWAYNFILECLNYTAPKEITAAITTHLSNNQININDVSILEMGALTGLLGKEFQKEGLKPKMLIGTDISQTVKSIPYNIYNKTFLLNANPEIDYEKIGKDNKLNFLTACGTFDIGNKITVDFAKALNAIQHTGKNEGYFVIDIVQMDLNNPDEQHPTKKTLELLKEKGYITYTIKPNIPYRTQTHGRGSRTTTILSGRKLKQIPISIIEEIRKF